MRADDLELARRCREGDAAAFETLYRAHAGRLFGLLTRMTGSAQDAEDLLQDVFVHAHRKLASFRGESSLGTWLYRLAVNQCLDHLRGKQSRMARATDSLDDDEARPNRPRRAGAARRPSRASISSARSRSCPTGCRAAFVLHDVEGLDHREVGAALGISEGTSKSQVHKARMKLRVLLRGWAPCHAARSRQCDG